MDELVKNVFEGKDVFAQYNLLDDEKKVNVCNGVCAELATQLDNGNKENINVVGDFLNQVNIDHAFMSIKTQIKLDRIIKNDLDDENRSFGLLIAKINEAHEAKNSAAPAVSPSTTTEE